MEIADGAQRQSSPLKNWDAIKERQVKDWKSTVNIFDDFLHDNLPRRKDYGVVFTRVFVSKEPKFHSLASIERQLGKDDVYKGDECNEMELFLSPETTLYELFLLIADVERDLFSSPQILVASIVYYGNSEPLLQEYLGAAGPITNVVGDLDRELNRSRSLTSLGFEPGNFLNIAFASTLDQVSKLERDFKSSKRQ